jgi:hypothetical protein
MSITMLIWPSGQLLEITRLGRFWPFVKKSEKSLLTKSIIIISRDSELFGYSKESS